MPRGRGTPRREREPISRAPGRPGRPSRPAGPNPRASIASARLEARSSEPATSGERSGAWPREPVHRNPRPRRLARPAASRSREGTSRVARATASAERGATRRTRRADRDRGAARRRRTRGERGQPQAVQRGRGELLVVTSSGPSTGIVGPLQRSDPTGGAEERLEREHPESGRERAEEVGAAAVGRGARRAASSTTVEQRRPGRPRGARAAPQPLPPAQEGSWQRAGGEPHPTTAPGLVELGLVAVPDDRRVRRRAPPRPTAPPPWSRSERKHHGRIVRGPALRRQARAALARLWGRTRRRSARPRPPSRRARRAARPPRPRGPGRRANLGWPALPAEPCRNGSGNAPTTSGPLGVPPQSRKSHQATSPGWSRWRRPPTSASMPLTN